jgi:hypothetical protein
MELRRLTDMKRFVGLASAALTAFVIGFSAVPTANAAPALTGTGSIVRDAVPEATEEVRWHGGRGFRGHRGYGHRGWRGYRHYGYYRPFRPVYVRPAYYGGGGCFWRPARQVWTPYGWRFRPAARICRW